ncbi:MAG: polymer-forming cytoskeletal protein [Marinilabiliales bacterium]|nr:polymer-forming cytoskeletal protein [Marinilabiliales bacterium]
MSKPVVSEFKALNTISQDTVIKGNIESGGDIRIDGILEGDLECRGRVVVGPESRIVGTIHCANAEILGFVKGEIIVKDILSLKSTASITGNLTMGKLSVEPGARFVGHCKMVSEEMIVAETEN